MLNATFHKWNETTGLWENDTLDNISGKQVNSHSGITLFNEFAIPRSAIGNTDAISLEAFTLGADNTTHIQDTVPSDMGVFDLDYDLLEDKGLDWTNESTTIGNFAYVNIKRYEIENIISQSGDYHFGMHPSDALTERYGGIGILVVDTIVSGDYDTAYVDLNNDHIFSQADIIINRSQPIAALDNFNHTSSCLSSDATAVILGLFIRYVLISSFI